MLSFRTSTIYETASILSSPRGKNMARRAFCALLTLVCMAAFSSPAQAQRGKIIVVRVLDGKTGLPVSPTNLMVRINEQQTPRSDGVRLLDDGTAEVTLPANAAVISVQAAYDSSMEIYINCDAAKEKDTSTEHWYHVAEILSSGVVAPNECGREKNFGKIKATAKPGEFVFFVRRRNWLEQ
jgi:hypothetical protein